MTSPQRGRRRPEPDASRWQRVSELFDQAAELGPDEQAALLAGLEPELADEVRSLLASAGGARDALRELVNTGAEALGGGAVEPWIGRRLGPWRVLEVLGEGGMGTVYLAEREDGQFHQRVAVKVLLEGLTSPAIVARFRDERQILAQLQHPAIVRLLDGGTTEEGLPWLAMEYIEGTTLRRFCAGLPVRQRVELVLQVAEAVEYAHQRLVVHRDLKPSNVLVGADGKPRLLDFGIAKLLEPAPNGAARGRQNTRTNIAFLTPEYASPEQARGDTVTVATDIYSLGAVLFDVLVGRPPQQGSDDVLQTLRAICEVEAPLPSAVAPPEVRRALQGDLDNIVLKALQKRPERRYPSVGAFAGDLRNYLTGRPVSAREATLRYRAGKFVRRHWVTLGLATTVAVSLVAGMVISVRLAQRAREEAARADDQAQTAARLNRTLLAEQGWREVQAENGGRALPWLVAAMRAGEDTPGMRLLVAEAVRPFEALVKANDFPEGSLVVSWRPDGKEYVASGSGGMLRVYGRYGELRASIAVAPDTHLHPVVMSPDGRWAAARAYSWQGEAEDRFVLIDLEARRLVHDSAGCGNGTTMLTADRAWRRILTSHQKGLVCVRDARTGAVVRRLEFPSRYGLVAAITPDGRRMVVSQGGRALELWDLDTGRRVARLGSTTSVPVGLAVSADGTRAFTTGSDASARIWSLPTLQELAVIEGGTGLVVSPDGALLFSRGRRGGAVYDALTGQLAWSAGASALVAQFSPDSRRLVTIHEDNGFRVWDAATGAPERTLEALALGGSVARSYGRSTDARFSPDGELLATATGARVSLWGVEKEPLLHEFRPRSTRTDGCTVPECVAKVAASFSPDQRQLAAVGEGSDVEVLDFRGGSQVAAFRASDEFTKLWDVGWSPDGTSLIITGGRGLARVFRATGGAPLVTLVGHQEIVNRGRYSQDGKRLLTAGDDHTARLWDAATGAPLRTLEHPHRVLAAEWSPDGTRILTACWDGAVRIWDDASGALLSTLTSPVAQLLDASYSPDGDRVVVARHDGDVDVWDLASGARVLQLSGSGACTSVTFSPDGALIAGSFDDLRVRIWDAATGKLLVTRVEPGPAMQARWSRDSKRIVSANMESVRVWDVHRDERTVEELVAFVEANVPWHLVDGRLEPVRKPVTTPRLPTPPQEPSQ